jgi:antibiotic biosynthesis monooxygenase (ABM) superfamily enzyme
MAEGETDIEQARVKAEGLARWFRERLSRSLTKLLVGLIVLGGLVTTLTTHHLVPGLVCLSLFVVIALTMIVRTQLILRELRLHPEHAVARLTKWRKLQRAGFAPVS